MIRETLPAQGPVDVNVGTDQIAPARDLSLFVRCER